MGRREREIWVAGYPSLVGGADTELDHNIDLWRRYDVGVNLVPMFGCDEQMRRLCDARGCHTHEYRPDIFDGRIVVSYCNGQFLDRLPEIMVHGPPRLVVWFNCMTWSFQKELDAHRNRWIGLFGFQSDYQRSCLIDELQRIGPVRELQGYRPYFHPENAAQQLEFGYHSPDQWFAMGRVSRDDAAKYPEDMWRIFYKVCAPLPTKTFILGYGRKAREKTGEPPPDLDWMTWSPGVIPVRELYGRLHVLIHKTGGSRESYCRIVPEAYAAGVPVVVEDDYAFPDLVVDGVTGYLCRSSDEMSFRAGELAFDEGKRKAMVYAARRHLLAEVAAPERCWRPWQHLLADA